MPRKQKKFTEKDSGSATVFARLDVQKIVDLDKIAAKFNRTRSAMIAYLLSKAIADLNAQMK